MHFCFSESFIHKWLLVTSSQSFLQWGMFVQNIVKNIVCPKHCQDNCATVLLTILRERSLSIKQRGEEDFV